MLWARIYFRNYPLMVSGVLLLVILLALRVFRGARIGRDAADVVEKQAQDAADVPSNDQREDEDGDEVEGEDEDGDKVEGGDEDGESHGDDVDTSSLFLHADEDAAALLSFFADDANYAEEEEEVVVRVNNE
jgi:hypothetical protein